MYIFRLSTPLQISQICKRRTSNVNTAAMPVVTVNTYLEKKKVFHTKFAGTGRFMTSAKAPAWHR